MDPLFPVDQVPESASDPVWPHLPPSSSAAAAMNRSPSEWSFQMFLQDVMTPKESDNNGNNHLRDRARASQQSDEVVEIEKPVSHHHHRPVRAPVISGSLLSSSSSPTAAAAASIKPDEYHAALKRQLDLACAAVAQSRKSSASPEPAASGTSAIPDRVPRTSFPAHVGPQTATGLPSSYPAAPLKDWGAVEFSASDDKPKIPAVQVKSSTSGSSRDQSDDDELDGEAETTGMPGLTDDKRARRMLSNRESARRSRRRKQEHMSELEGQAAQLRTEHSSLLKNLNESNQKYTEASVNLRVLKADVETLRAKVMMAEEKVKRLTGVNSLQPFTEIPRMNLPFHSSPLASIGSNMLPNANHMIQMPAVTAHHSPSPSPSPHHGP